MGVRTVEQLAGDWTKHPQTIRKLIKTGKLRALQDVPGGRILIRDEDAEAYLESIRIEPDLLRRHPSTGAPDPSPGRAGRHPSPRQRAS
jgi:excisionase family DNA binding protein